MRLAPACRPSLTSAWTYSKPSAAALAMRANQAAATASTSRSSSSANERAWRGLWITTSWRSNAGYRFGTTRTCQPGEFAGSRAGSVSVSGGVRSSRPSQKGQLSSSASVGSSITGTPTPGRRARPGATTTWRPETGSTRSSPGTAAHCKDSVSPGGRPLRAKGVTTTLSGSSMKLACALLLLLLTPGVAHAAGASGAARELPPAADRLSTATPFQLVGLHWRGPGTVLLRTRLGDGRWTRWVDAVPEADGPDVRGGEDGTEGWQLGSPRWVGRADRLQIRRVGPVGAVRAYLVRAGREPGAAAHALGGRRAADHPAAGLGRTRGDPPRRPGGRAARPHHRRAPHGRDEQLHAGPVGRDRARDHGLPRPVERLGRHRLQLSRRPLRPGLRRPVRGDRAERGRRPRRRLQHRHGGHRGHRLVRLLEDLRGGAGRAHEAHRLAHGRRACRPARAARLRLERQRALPEGGGAHPARRHRPPGHRLHVVPRHRARGPAGRHRAGRCCGRGPEAVRPGREWGDRRPRSLQRTPLGNGSMDGDRHRLRPQRRRVRAGDGRPRGLDVGHHRRGRRVVHVVDRRPRHPAGDRDAAQRDGRSSLPLGSARHAVGVHAERGRPRRHDRDLVSARGAGNRDGAPVRRGRHPAGDALHADAAARQPPLRLQRRQRAGRPLSHRVDGGGHPWPGSAR